ncbi:MAG: RagB/SusD family nutrient uptake outer membrane protein [Bacteroidales bacterium]|nr:RagB/SusD family nutrient uptake outer membrane protein [Bacteroidales bacterium]
MRKFLTILLLPTLFSCTRYLDVKPRGYDIPGTLEQYSGMIYGQEYMLMDEVFEYMSFEFTTDADGYGNAYANMGSDICNAYCWKKDIFLPDENCGEWNYPASFLYPMNVVIAEVMGASNGTEAERKAVLAEARMVRAWMLFTMAQFFGMPYNEATAASDPCIPLITTASTLETDYPRKSVAQVYEFILNEMREAIPDLADESEHFKRVFKPTGEAMLGKVLWMMGNYKEAESVLASAWEDALGSGCALLDYNTRLKDDKTLDLPTDWVQNSEYLFLFSSMARLWPAVYTTYYNSIIFSIKDEVLAHYFSPGDTRLAQLTGIPSGASAYPSAVPGQRYAANTSSMLTNIGIGLADVCLMYAECLARSGKDSEAAALLEEFRKHRMDSADAPVSGDLVVAAVEERMREYIGFGNTWLDMRRLWDDPAFQYMKDWYTHTDGSNEYTLTKERLVMEIPPKILSWHPEYSNN